MGKNKRNLSCFRTGSHGGCEALLYEFHERVPLFAKPTSTESAEQPKPHTKRIAATTFDEALEYLRWEDPDFVVDRVRNLGLIVMVSGSPLN